MSTTTIAPTLNSRLASACNCAYGVSDTTGKYTPPAIYDAAVNWSATPKPFAAATSPGQKLINAALVGVNQDGIIVAFRGTLPPSWTPGSLEDWWQDIVDSEPISAPPLPGKVHSGFWHGLQSIYSGVLGEVQSLQRSHPGAAIYVTGHSKGGPLASLGAAQLYLQSNIQAAGVVTFASPHPGDHDFVNQYPAVLQPVTAFENYLDIVPFLPPTDAFFQDFEPIANTWLGKEFCKYFPYICNALSNASKWNYASLGQLNYVTSSGKVVGSDNPLAAPDYRLVQILLTLFGLNSDAAETFAELASQAATSISHSGLSTIGAAHCIACKADTPTDFCAGGYMTGAGGDPICPTGS